MFEGYIAGKFANQWFEKDVFKSIKTHALVAALILSIPDFGLGTIFYVIILWHMYSSICTKVGISFSEHFWKLVGLGFIVNILIALFLDIILTFAFFLEGFLIYFQFYFSGKLFVESLKKSNIKVAQQNNNVKALPANQEIQSVTINSFQYSTLRPVKTGKGFMEDLRTLKNKNNEDFLLKADILYLANQYGVSENMALSLAQKITENIN